MGIVESSLWVLNVSMRLLCLTLFFICSLFSLLGNAEVVEIKGDLQLPENYHHFEQLIEDRGQIIPHQANRATSPSAFSLKIVEYHIVDALKQNRWAPFKNIKSIEQAMNQNAEIKSESFRIKTKLDVNRMQAHLDIETFVRAKFWTENSLKTVRSQMKIYERTNGFVSLENRLDSVDNRTYLNVQQTW